MGALNQVLAKEQQIKKDSSDSLKKAYHAFQKPPLFEGQTRVYAPLDDNDTETLPDENQNIQLNVEQLLGFVAQTVGDFWDITLTKDVANTQAFADIVVDGETIVEKVPATFLLWMEKQLIDVQTQLGVIPTLDPTDKWTKDESQGVWRSQSVTTTRSKKVPRVLVKYQATEEHPAQTEVFHEDVIIGNWTKTKFSAAIPVPKKDDLLRRVSKLRQAIQVAREQANMVQVTDQKVSEKLFGYLFSGVTE